MEAGLAFTEAARNPFRTKPRASLPQGESGRARWPGRGGDTGQGVGRPCQKEEPALPLDGWGRRGRTLGAGGLAGCSPWCRVGIWGEVPAEPAARAVALVHLAPAWGHLGQVVPQATTSAAIATQAFVWSAEVEGATGSLWAGRSARGPAPAGHPASGLRQASGLPSSLPSDVCPLRICCHSRSAPPAGPVTGSELTGGELGFGRGWARSGSPPATPVPYTRGILGTRAVLAALQCVRGSSSSFWHFTLGAPRELCSRPRISQRTKPQQPASPSAGVSFPMA